MISGVAKGEGTGLSLIGRMTYILKKAIKLEVRNLYVLHITGKIIFLDIYDAE